MEWTKPEIVVIKMDAEIGSYQEDGGGRGNAPPVAPRTTNEEPRDGYLRNIVTTNEHAPDPFRALTVRNIDGWYQAFNVKPGQKLYLAPNQRVKIWG